MAADLGERLARFRDEISPLQYLLLNEQYPPNLTTNQRRSLRRQKDNHMIKENKLYRKRRNNWVQIATTPGEVIEILKFFHGTSGSHIGIVNTKTKIATKYYWFGMSKDVDEYISTCPACQSFKVVKTQAPTLKQIKVSHPMQVMGLDLIELPARWSEELTYKFVMLYREHECLWNMRSEIYRNKQARQNALSDICVKMELENFGINDVKQKIKSLKAAFQQEQTKVEKSELSGAGTQDKYKPSVKWFPVMSNIMKQGVLKQTPHSNLDTADDGPGVDDHVSESDVKDGDSTQHSPQSEDIDGKLTQVVSKQKIRSRKQVSEVSAVIKELKELNKTITSPKQDNDECETFGKYVAVLLQKLNPEDCILAQEEIQRVLTQYRLAAISSNKLGPAPPPPSISPAPSSSSSDIVSIATPRSVSPAHSLSESYSQIAYITLT